MVTDIHSQQYKDSMPWKVIEWGDGMVQIFVDDGFDEIYVRDCGSVSQAKRIVVEHNDLIQS